MSKKGGAFSMQVFPSDMTQSGDVAAVPKVSFSIDAEELEKDDNLGPLVESIATTMPGLAPNSPAAMQQRRPRKKHPKVHEMFVELFDLKQQQSSDGGNEFEWRETARWMKYEEDVEGVDYHWGRPHVAFLPFHALLQLRNCLQEGVVLLDLEANNFEDICKHIAHNMAQMAAKSSKTETTMTKSTKQSFSVPDMGQSSDTTSSFPSAAKESAILNTLTLIGMRHVIDNPLRRITSNVGMMPDEHKVSTVLRKFSQARQVDAEIARHEIRTEIPNIVVSVPEEKPKSSLFRKFSTPFAAFATTQRSVSPSGNGPIDSPPIGNKPISNNDIEAAKGDMGGAGTLGKTSLNVPASSNRSHPKMSIINSIASFTDVIEKEHILNRLDADTEAAQVFVGVVDELSAPRFAMVRLAEALDMPQLIEAPVPIRFLFVILGPQLGDINYHEVGRAIATLMSDRYFHGIAYQATQKSALLTAMDKFLDMSVVIPPGEIDHKRLISADEIKKVLRRRRKNANIPEEGNYNSGLTCSGPTPARPAVER